MLWPSALFAIVAHGTSAKNASTYAWMRSDDVGA